MEDDESKGTEEKKGKRGPGRPPTSGDYINLAAAKEESNAKLREEEAIMDEKRIRSVSSDKLFSSMKLDLHGAVEELSDTPSQDLAIKGQKCMERPAGDKSEQEPAGQEGQRIKTGLSDGSGSDRSTPLQIGRSVQQR